MSLRHMADSVRPRGIYVMHCVGSPSSISFPSYLSEAPPLLAATANLTPRSCPKRVAFMRMQVRCLACDPQRWERQQQRARIPADNA